MNAEFLSITQAAATEAEGYQGESFLAPDGKTYLGTFRAPTAFEIASAGLQMEANGFPDRTIQTIECTRTQFGGPPWSWRRSAVPIIRSSPVQKLTVCAMTDDDPLYYGFVVMHRQPEN